MKWTTISEKKCSLRSITNKNLKVPKKPKLKCLGFTYNGAKLFNMLPIQMRETKNLNTFKTMTNDWIWKNIPSYYVLSSQFISYIMIAALLYQKTETETELNSYFEIVMLDMLLGCMLEYSLHYIQFLHFGPELE